MWFDNHCHLTSLEAEPRQVVERAVDAGVTGLLTIGVTVADSARAQAVAASFDNVWSTAGVHPHEAKHGTDGLAELLADPNLVAVGECGLDYHYDHSPRSIQADVFRRQIALANALDRALVIHTREAWDDTFTILDAEGTPQRTVFHCFTGGVDEVQGCLARGASISYSGIVTFKNADDIRSAARATPLDKLLIETDSPYLAPAPDRRFPNEPAKVAVIGAYLARLLDVEESALAATTTANARTLYRL